MRNLLQFIYRYHFFFLFILLFSIAMVLNASRQHYKQALIWHSGNALSANLYQLRSNVLSYFHLRQVNKDLLEENLRLLNQRVANYLITADTTFVKKDSLHQRRYTYLYADVINNSVTLRNNYITLNKGANHGLEPNMGVITPNGVVGIIKAVSNNYSLVISLLHSETMVSAKIERNDHIGSLYWNGENYRMASMAYIPPHVELEKGEEVVTSGFSTIFPEHIPVGKIRDWRIRRGETFYTANVELHLDFNKLTHVYVVKNLLQEEQEALESQASSEL